MITNEENSNGCLICGGVGTCLYCRKIEAKLENSPSELMMFDIVQQGGKLVYMSLKKRKITCHEISRNQIEDMGTFMITSAFETSRHSYPLMIYLGNYQQNLSQFLEEGQKIGKILATPLKVATGEQYVSKIVAFEVLNED